MILIDDRKGSKELAAYLPNLATLTTLDAGDAAFLGYGPDGPMTYPIGIERKAFGDLITCFGDGRLSGSQIPKMTGCYKRIYLIVEGRPRTTKDGHLLLPRKQDGVLKWVESKFTYRQLDNFLNSLEEELHIQIKRSFDMRETAWQIEDLYFWWSKATHNSQFNFDTSAEPFQLAKPNLRKRVAAQLAGIGWGRAGSVAAYFPSVWEMVNATEQEWMKIAGIGKTLAKKVVAQLRGL